MAIGQLYSPFLGKAELENSLKNVWLVLVGFIYSKYQKETKTQCNLCLQCGGEFGCYLLQKTRALVSRKAGIKLVPLLSVFVSVFRNYYDAKF